MQHRPEENTKMQTMLRPTFSNFLANRLSVVSGVAAAICCGSALASSLPVPAATPVQPTLASASARPVDERQVFLSPFLPAANPTVRVQGAVQVDFLPELLDMIPLQGVYDIVQFPMPDGTLRDLWVTEFRVTNEETTIAVMKPGKDGEPVADYSYTPQVRTFRGHVTGVDNSLVYLAFSPTAISGFISLDGRVYSISNGPRGEMPVVISDTDNLPEGAINWYEYACQALERPQGGGGSSGGDGGVAELATCKVLQMAFETDNEFRGLFASEQAAIDYATQIAAGMNAIYLEEQNLFPLMSFLRVWAPGVSDPWSGNGSGAQLNQFVAAWGGGGGPAGSTPRDLAPLISARDLGGGVAYLDAVCDPDFGFAVSGNINGFFPFPLQNNSAQNWDIMVTTHEMGHNCGCNHTHDLGVDNCVGGACIPNGTIMSYCHLCPGGLANVVLQFADANKAQMDAFLATAACLSEPCPIYDPASFKASDGAFIDAVRLTWISPSIAALRFEIERRVAGGGAFTSLNPNVLSNATSYDDTTAVVGTTYEYRIRAVRVDTGNPSDWVGPDSGYKGVLGPTGLQASDGDFADRIALVWEAPAGYTPLSYSIYRGTAGSTPLKIDEVPATALEYDDTGAYTEFDPSWPDSDGDMNPGPPPATEVGPVYYYEVRAEVSASTMSAPSTDTGFRSPAGPANLLATGALNGTTPPLTDRIRLTWSLPGPVNSVYVYKQTAGGPFVEVARIGGSPTRWNDLQVIPNIAYSYKVRSFSNLLGLSAPSDIDLGFVLPPPAVTSASDGAGSDVVVTWAKPAAWNPSAYSVWRKRSGRDPWPALPIASDLSASTLSFTDTTAEPGAVYVYAVSGKSGQFNSYSDRGSPNTGYPTVLPPTGVTASDGTNPGFVQISWTPTGATTNVSWQVFRRISGSGSTFSLIRTVTQPVHLDSSAQAGVVYEYQVKTRASNGVVSASSASDTGFR
ncbi:MAG: M12 family metallo-peptidase [bacterium]